MLYWHLVMKMTKNAILELLRQHTDVYVSGTELAKALSGQPHGDLEGNRAASWKKAMKLTRLPIRVTGFLPRATCFGKKTSENISRRRAWMGGVYRSITSTNTVLKTMAEEGAPEGLCLIAGEQTAGRGRRGRSFYSPPDSGIYLSVLLRPALQAVDATSITACAAVAVAEAIESLAPVKARRSNGSTTSMWTAERSAEF